MFYYLKTKHSNMYVIKLLRIYVCYENHFVAMCVHTYVNKRLITKENIYKYIVLHDLNLSVTHIHKANACYILSNMVVASE